jgi:hypothetical protein
VSADCREARWVRQIGRKADLDARNEVECARRAKTMDGFHQSHPLRQK